MYQRFPSLVLHLENTQFDIVLKEGFMSRSFLPQFWSKVEVQVHPFSFPWVSTIVTKPYKIHILEKDFQIEETSK